MEDTPFSDTYGIRWLYVSTYVYVVILLSGFTLFLTACSGPADESAALSGNLRIAGSTALQPLATAAANLYQKQHPQVHIEVSGGGSLFGLQAVTDQQADIGDSDVYADPAQFPDPNLTDQIVSVIPFTMIGGPGVTVTSLTTQQIIDIFSTGKIRNWNQVGGQNLPIVPVVRPATSGTRAIFRKYIIDGRDEMGKLLKVDSSTAVLDTVAHTPGAIGYLALSVLNSQVKAIAIDGQSATPANIEHGRYPFWGYEHMYTLHEENNLIASYLDFMLTPTIQHLAQQLGYIPIVDMKLSTAAPSPATSLSPAQASSLPLKVGSIVESEVHRREFL